MAYTAMDRREGKRNVEANICSTPFPFAPPRTSGIKKKLRKRRKYNKYNTIKSVLKQERLDFL